MNTKQIVRDLRNENEPFNADAVYNIWDNYDYCCAHLGAFKSEVKRNDLTNDEKVACLTFIEGMKEKYGVTGTIYVECQTLWDEYQEKCEA